MIYSDHFLLIKRVNKIWLLDSDWSHITVKVHLLKMFKKIICATQYFASVAIPHDFLCNRYPRVAEFVRYFSVINSRIIFLKKEMVRLSCLDSL